MKSTQVLILAAGQGKRMGGGDEPKVIKKILGKPMISWLVDSVRASGICDKPTVVVGHGAEYVKKVLGDKVQYAEQKELLGTGHAVMSARPLLENNYENLLVLYGDHPFVSKEVIRNLAETHLREGKMITIMTTTVPDFRDWRAPLHDFGRIIRDKNGKILRIVEKRDANAQKMEIKELNPGLYCFRASWLWPQLEKLKNNNAQGEYYLTDLIGLAINENEELETVSIDPKECLGINSREQLELIEKLFTN